MNLIGTNTHLGAEAKAHPIAHAGAGVPKDAGAVDALLELFGDERGGGEDAVGVVGGVGVDVGDGEGAGGESAFGGVGGRWGGDGFDGEDRGEEFGGVVFFCCVLKECGLSFWEGRGEGGFGKGVAAERDASFEEGGGDGREGCAEGGFVDEERFH